jgi:putative ABC transport system permease protein
MRAKQVASFAFESLKRDSVRSALTLVGIFLGLFTAVIILGVGKGIILEVQDLVSQFGTDKIIVIPININKVMAGGSSGFSLVAEFSASDITSLRSISCVSRLGEAIFKNANVEYRNKTISTLVLGITTEYFDMYPNYLVVEKGRLFKDTESSSVVIGYTIAHSMFGEDVTPGKKIMIGNRTFTVVGVMRKVGTSFSQQDDEQIYVPLKEAENILNMQGKRDEAEIQVAPGCDINAVKSNIESLLARRRGTSVENADFSVVTTQFIIDKVNDSLNVLYIGATAVGLIASLVSAVGIANTMFTSVFRRKKEIGIMKALGAKRSDIINIFLFESVMLSLIGAALGAAFGILVGIAIKELYGIPFAVDYMVAAVAVIVGVAIGVIAGILPARSAASIDAIEAMR